MVKSTRDNVIYALAHIYNKSFAEGKFIIAFKKTKVIPVFKKGCHSDVANADLSVFYQLCLKFWKKYCTSE